MRYTKIDITKHGGRLNGSFDNHSILTSLFINNPAKKIIIGDDASDICIVSKPLYITSNTCLEINGVLKMQSGIIRALTQDAVVGDVLMYVENASSYYKVGQWVSVTCNSMPTGGAGYIPRQMGACSRVKSVTSTYVELDYPLRNTMQNQAVPNMLVSDNARIGHTQTGLIIEGVDNVVLKGTGTIDCSYPTLLNVHPNSLDTTLPLPGYEESRGGNGILLWEVTNFKMLGLKLQETNIAGITMYKVSGYEMRNIEVYHSYMKCIATTTEIMYGIIDNANLHDSYNEDGLSLHDDTHYLTATNITITNTLRAALACNAGSNNNVFKNITINGGIIGLNTVSGLTSYVTQNNKFENITISNCNYSLLINKVKDSIFNEVVINGTWKRGYCIAIGGDVDGIVFNGGGCYDTDTNVGNGQGVRIIAKGSYAAEATDIVFNDFEFKRLRLAISEESGGLASDIVFNDCTISDNTSNGDVASEVFTFNDCIIT